MQDETLKNSHDDHLCRWRVMSGGEDCHKGCGCKCHRFDCHTTAGEDQSAGRKPDANPAPEPINPASVDAEIVFIKRTMMERGDKPGSVMLHPDTVVVLKDRGYVDEEITPAGRRTATAGGLPICATTVIEPGQISISVAKPPNETPPVEIDCPKVYRDFLRIIEAMGRKDDKPSAVLMNPATALALVAAGMTAVDKCDDGTYLDTLDGLPIYGVTVIPAGEAGHHSQQTTGGPGAHKPR